MGNINSNVKRLIRYNNIRYKEFSKRIGLGVGTVRSAFSRDKDEVWMRAFEYGYELGRIASQAVERFDNGCNITFKSIDKKKFEKDAMFADPDSFDSDGAVEKTAWQEKLRIQKGEN